MAGPVSGLAEALILAPPAAARSRPAAELDAGLGAVFGLFGVLVGATLASTPLQLSVEAQLLIAVPVVALLGLPHGAVDPLLGRAVWASARPGRPWVLPFGVSYLALLALVIAAWALAPGVSLGLFLLGSAYHFGTGDAVGLLRGRARWLEAATRGLLPLAIPAWSHPEAVTELFALLAPAGSAELLAEGLGLLGVPTLLLWVVTWLWAAITTGPPEREAARSGHLLELGALPGLFLGAPPLLAFALYFGVLHSGRHLLGLAARLDSEQPARAWLRLGLLGLPLTGVTILGALAALPFLLGAFGGLATTVQVLFVGLAALTLPHAILVELGHART